MIARRRWTPAEDAILRAWYPHGGLREVRERLPARRSDRESYRRAHDLGVRADCRAPRQSDAVSLVALQGTAVRDARVLRVVRRARGLLQEDLAAKAGYGSHTISRWECGRATPHLSSLVDCLQAMGFELVLREIGR